MWKHKEVSVSLPIIDAQPEWIERTWRERLLSWPWRPWIKMKRSPWALIIDATERTKREMMETCGIPDLYK